MDLSIAYWPALPDSGATDQDNRLHDAFGNQIGFHALQRREQIAQKILKRLEAENLNQRSFSIKILATHIWIRLLMSLDR